MNKLRIALATAIVSGALIAPGAASAQSALNQSLNGANVVNLANVPAGGSLEQQLLSLGVQRASALEQLVKSQITAMQAKNMQIQQLNAELQKARTAGDTATAAKLQAQIDALSSQAQLEMIKLQSMVSKQNSSIEMVSNLSSKFASLKDQIVGNMR